MRNPNSLNPPCWKKAFNGVPTRSLDTDTENFSYKKLQYVM